MGKSSLSAYAAWLAKHETKAPRRRSLDRVPDPEVVHVVKDATAGESSDPYLQWAKRKETKTPLVKVVMATPEAIDEIVERGRAAVAMAQASKAGLVKLGGAAGSKRFDGKTARVQVEDSKGKKRRAPDSTDADTRVEKKAKATAAETSGRKTSSTQSPQHTGSEEHRIIQKRPSTLAAANCPASSRVKLPMLEEVKYWRDVDRFSFLA